jgi:hypothetical protein
MSDSSGGLGSGTDTTQGDIARGNASQRQGNGKLLSGDRSDRDVSRDQNAKSSTAPPPMPETRWQPPRQPVGNPKGERL